MSTLGHGVVIAELALAIVSTSDNTGSLEPSPGSGNLTSVTAEREALRAIAASSRISNRKERLEFSISRNAESVIKSLSGAVSPAGAAVGLVTNMVDNIATLGPGFTGIEVLGESNSFGVVGLLV